MKWIKRWGLLCIMLYLCSTVSHGLNWNVIESTHFSLYYPKPYEEQAKRYINHLESSRDVVGRIIGRGLNKIPVILEDMGFNENGSATVFPPRVRLQLGIPSSYKWAHFLSYDRLLSTHELVHMAHHSEVSGANKILRYILGNTMYPNPLSPSWLSEGFAVYVESLHSPYEGRLNEGYYDAAITVRAANKALGSLSWMTTGFMDSLLGDKPYMFGSKFVQFIAESYGEETLKKFVRRQGNRFILYSELGLLFPSIGIDAVAKEVYGKSFKQLHEEWSDSLERKTSTFKYQGTPIITSKPRGESPEIVSLTEIEKTIVTVEKEISYTNPFEIEIHYVIKSYDSLEEPKDIVRQVNAIRGAIHSKNKNLYYLEEDLSTGYENNSGLGLGVEHQLVVFNRESKKKNIILKGRVRSFCVSDTQKVYYTIDVPGKEASELWVIEDNEKIFIKSIKMLVSEMVYYKGKLILAAKKEGKVPGIYTYSINTNKVETYLETHWPITSLRRQGNALMYTSNENKQYGVFSINLESRKVYKLAEEFYARSGVVVDTMVYYITLTPTGEAVYKQRKKQVVYKKKAAPQATKAPANVESTLSNYGKIRSLKGIFPFLRFPLLLGEDHIGLNRYKVEYKREVESFSLGVSTRLFSPMLLSYNYYFRTKLTALSSIYPVYRSVKNGLNKVDVGVFHYSQQIDDKHYQIGYGALMSQFHWPYYRLNTEYVMNPERGGGQVLINNKLYTKNSELKIQMKQYQSYEASSYLRGVGAFNYFNESGTDFHVDLSKRMGTLNKGLWNPNIAVGSIFGTIFMDHSSLIEEKDAYGVEIEIELDTGIGAFDGLNLEQAFGVSWVDNTIKPYIDFSINLQGYF